jgi:hypothetical protein
VYVSDNLNGTYLVSYTPQVAGQYDFTIEIKMVEVFSATASGTIMQGSAATQVAASGAGGGAGESGPTERKVSYQKCLCTRSGGGVLEKQRHGDSPVSVHVYPGICMGTSS